MWTSIVKKNTLQLEKSEKIVEKQITTVIPIKPTDDFNQFVSPMKLIDIGINLTSREFAQDVRRIV